MDGRLSLFRQRQDTEIYQDKTAQFTAMVSDWIQSLTSEISNRKLDNADNLMLRGRFLIAQCDNLVGQIQQAAEQERDSVSKTILIQQVAILWSSRASIDELLPALAAAKSATEQRDFIQIANKLKRFKRLIEGGLE